MDHTAEPTAPARSDDAEAPVPGGPVDAADIEYQDHAPDPAEEPPTPVLAPADVPGPTPKAAGGPPEAAPEPGASAGQAGPAPAEDAALLPAAAAADAAADLARTDTALGRIAATSGALLAIMAAGVGLSSGDGRLPAASLAVMGTAGLVLAAVLALVAVASWPRRGGTGGVPHYARRSPAQLAAELATADPARWHAERAVAKSAIAERRYRYQRAAEAGQALAGALLAVAIVAALT